jgi:lipopolysaccharide export system permease protein
MKTLDRYLLREMAGPFLFGVLAFVLLFVSAQILFELMELVNTLGIDLWTAGYLFLLWLPAFIVYTFPLATLVAILISFGRLSGDSELVAMYAGGISFRRLVVPLVAAGLVVSLVTVGINELVVPAANRRAEEIVRAAAAGGGKAAQERVFYSDSYGEGVSRLVYAEKLDLATGEMIRPIIIWFEKGEPRIVTVAQKARWRGNSWEMLDAVHYLLDAERPGSVEFPRMISKFTTSPDTIARSSRKPEEMTYRELREHVRQLTQQGRKATELELTLYHKLSIPFACLVFSLIAPPLGIRSHRGSSSIGMGIAILIGFGYYVVWHYLSAVAQQGHLSPLWAAWLPNVVGAAVGMALILGVRK